MKYIRKIIKLKLIKLLLSKNIKKKISILLLLILFEILINAQPLQYFEKEFIKIVNKAKESVVKIKIFYQDNTRKIISGIIMDKEGYIVTLASLLKNHKNIKIYLNSGEEIKAKFIGEDKLTDIGLLKIKSSDINLTPVSKCNSDKLKVGSFLITIGNPFGLRNSVSYGIVSGLNRVAIREINGKEEILGGLIQTTAPINPGDEGGLAVDSKGNFVGMILSSFRNTIVGAQPRLFSYILEFLFNSYKKDSFLGTSNSSISCINFILPSKVVVWVYKNLKKYKKIERVSLGIRIKKNGNILKIIYIDKNKPAYKSGIRKGDILLRINNQKIKTIEEIIYMKVFFIKNSILIFKIKRNIKGKEIIKDIKIKLK